MQVAPNSVPEHKAFAESQRQIWTQRAIDAKIEPQSASVLRRGHHGARCTHLDLPGAGGRPVIGLVGDVAHGQTPIPMARAVAQHRVPAGVARQRRQIGVVGVALAHEGRRCRCAAPRC
ncbi:hypothetical protein G6F46_014507 [Rhizopus delemar]|nr:hypothetical protein G6F46_014507 [Rhizopus delemar]